MDIDNWMKFMTWAEITFFAFDFHNTALDLGCSEEVSRCIEIEIKYTSESRNLIDMYHRYVLLLPPDIKLTENDIGFWLKLYVKRKYNIWSQ